MIMSRHIVAGIITLLRIAIVSVAIISGTAVICVCIIAVACVIALFGLVIVLTGFAAGKVTGGEGERADKYTKYCQKSDK